MKTTEINYAGMWFEIEYEYEKPTHPYDPTEAGFFEVYGVYASGTKGNLIELFNESTAESIREAAYREIAG